VEEQTATTNEMSRNVTEAARGSTEIAQNMSGARDSRSTDVEVGCVDKDRLRRHRWDGGGAVHVGTDLST